MDDLLKLVKMYDARGRQINKLQRVLNRKNRRIHRQHMQLKSLSQYEPSPPVGSNQVSQQPDPTLLFADGYWKAAWNNVGSLVYEPDPNDDTLPGSAIQYLEVPDEKPNAYDEVTAAVAPDAD